MPGRRTITLGAAAVLIGTAGGFLLFRPEKREGEGVVRVVAAPSATPSRVPAMPAAWGTPPVPSAKDGKSDSGVDPPAPREAGSPNYAELGVQPAI